VHPSHYEPELLPMISRVDGASIPTPAFVNYENRQERQAIRDADLIHLGDEFDIGEFDGEYGLVPIKEPY